MERTIILGSGLAGYTIAREIRKLDRNLPITLITRDSGDFYSKPMLSSALAQGKTSATLISTTAADMASQLGIDLLPLTQVTSIDRGLRQVHVSGRSISYRNLVFALGADPIRLPLQGDAGLDVLSVNDLTDYAEFRNRLNGARHVAIMGAGLIGCEFAHDLASAGFQVSVIDPAATPLAALLPAQAGAYLQVALSRLGVDLRMGVSVQAVDHLAGQYALKLSDASTLQADLVLSAVGLRPRVTLARDAGVVVNRGIVVNEQLRTSDPAIFALGDCAEYGDRVLPYVQPLVHAARCLAQVLTGADAALTFPVMPVVVKTPSHPVVTLPVARDASGVWKMLDQGNGIKMGFFDRDNTLRGFALTGEFSSERSEMASRVGVHQQHAL